MARHGNKRNQRKNRDSAHFWSLFTVSWVCGSSEPSLEGYLAVKALYPLFVAPLLSHSTSHCRIMSLGRLLVEKHSKIAAVVFPVSVLGGFAYTMKTGTSPLADSKDWVQGVHG